MLANSLLAPSWSWMANGGNLVLWPSNYDRGDVPIMSQLRNCSFMAGPDTVMPKTPSDLAVIKLTGALISLCWHTDIQARTSLADEWERWIATVKQQTHFRQQRTWYGKLCKRANRRHRPEFVVQDLYYPDLYSLSDSEGSRCGGVKLDFDEEKPTTSTGLFLVVGQDILDPVMRPKRSRRRIFYLLALQLVSDKTRSVLSFVG